MSEFPPNAFSATGGTLSQWVVDDPENGVDPHVVFSLEIAFAPFEVGEESVETALWLGGLDPSVAHWRELAGRAPFADPSELDASLRLFGSINPVELSRFKFGEAGAASLEVSLSGEIDFEMEGHDEFGRHHLDVAIPVEAGPLRVSKAIETRCERDETAIDAFLRPHLDLSGFGPLEKAPGSWTYPVLHQ